MKIKLFLKCKLHVGHNEFDSLDDKVRLEVLHISFFEPEKSLQLKHEPHFHQSCLSSLEG